MARPSSIDRLPAEIREEIGRLRDAGRTIDEILAHLRTLEVGVSRSALARHTQELDAIAETIRRSRGIAEGVTRALGEDEGRVARFNVEMCHAIVMKAMVGEDGQPAEFDPKELMFISTTLQKLTQAAKTDADLALRIRREAAQAAAKEAEAAAGEMGLSRETVETIKARILGVTA